MEKENKIRISCSNCLSSKILKRIDSDPPKTRFIIHDSCDNCCVESDNEIMCFDENMNKLN